MASVVVGKPINGIQLTEMREMDQCPKSDLARTRVVATNKGSKTERYGSDQSISETSRHGSEDTFFLERYELKKISYFKIE
jgi:hypothetical protein